MKSKVMILAVIILVAMLVAPTPALAYTGVVVQVRDNLTNDYWAYGGTVYIYDQTAGALIAAPAALPEGPAAGPVTISYTGVPAQDDAIVIYVVTNPGPDGSPGVLTHAYTELAFVPGNYPAPTIQTGTGPNSIELIDFSVAPQSNSSIWLPFALLIGSVVLVSGAVAVIRKRQI